ncbi:hypothetical protein POL68_23895 [Stigmatella sp. ncwal1]|uniref:DUF2946 domain-containing protein n=1 Tax=Stigmatella ashevillensis TaxID=2995309 RepID=A0ABT5DEN0_9BACT|nr:hypothetical protein [Stigmatella ashevillena]MDC0711534.1 hypothetical protein [Stigmatella ashevillena]
MLRVLLIAAVIAGLVPFLGEALEMVVHYASTGHVAHFEPGETDLDAEGKEHGCGPIAHHCGCCVSQWVMLPSVSGWVPGPQEPEAPFLAPGQRLTPGVLRRLLRPPIAA